MKTTRRNFLKWSGIGALGTIVFNGCGIPDEELHVQSPAQMPEDLVSGLEAWYATSCAQCGAGEGIIVRVIEGRAIKIEGNPDHPVSQGKSSVRCQAGLQALYNPDRITGPLRRVGARGSGEFEPIGWGEAEQQLMGHLNQQVGNPGSVVMVTEPLRGTLGMVAGKFMDAYGGSHMAFESMEQTVLRAAVKRVFQQDRLPDFDIANADYILNFGADFLSTWLSPVRYSRAYGEFRQGDRSRGTLVQVEPRMSMTAANADRWIYVNPGWEGVLAISIAYVLMSNHSDRIDEAAAQAMTGGRGAADLAAFAPQEVADDVGVSAQSIEKLAEELVTHSRSLVIGGGPAGAHTNGLTNLSAIYSLNHLVGSVGKTGGVIFNPDSSLGDVPATAEVASYTDWQTLSDKMRADEINLMLVRGANPVYGLPDSLDFRAAIDDVPTLVSFSSFIDETTALADLVMPDHVYLEAWGDDIPEPGPGYQAVTFQQPVVYPFYREADRGTKAFGDVLLGVAQQMGGSVAGELPWPTMKEALRSSAQKLHALGRGSVQAGDFEAFWNTILQRGGWWDSNAKGPAQAGTPPRAPQRLEDARPDIQGPTGEDAFHLMPFSSLSLTDGKGANLPWLQATPDPLTTAVWHTWAEINLKQAEDMGIKEGDHLEIQSPTGNIVTVLAYPTPAAAPGVLSVPTGQGHTVYGDFEVGPDISRFRSLVGKGRGANVLSLLAPRTVNDTGVLAWSATRVRVVRTGEWTRLSKFEGTVPATLPSEVIPVTRTE